jgi:hypothetical protein
VQRIRTARHGQEDAANLISVLRDRDAPGGSSLGGDCPKTVFHTYDGDSSAFVEILFKFPPRPDSEIGVRWRNLLVMERLCLEALGPRAADGDAIGGGLLVSSFRFDRTEAGGRIGAATLQWLAASRGEADRSAPEVMASLHKDGLVDSDSVTTCELAHLFSRAIGNTDAHLGNYGLVFDEDGKAKLAPLYDVLPMALAPRFDELPDERLKPRASPIDPRVQTLFDELVKKVRASDLLDAPFKDLWLRHVGA